MSDRDEMSNPFESLREPIVPLAPPAAFASRLRRRLAQRLGVAEPRRTPVPETREYTPARSHSLTPYLSCPRAVEAIDWYVEVLDAVAMEPPIIMDDGRVGHAELRVGDTVFSVADEWPDLNLAGPGDTVSVSLMLYVPDVEDTLERALERGATIDQPLREAYGARRATIRDPFGHRWMLGTALEPDDVPVEDVPGRRQGDIGYVTMMVPDGDRARRFFSALFEWDVVPGNLEGGYHIASITPPAGIMTTGDDSERGARVYFRVDNIESVAQRVRDLGGEVLAVNQYDSGGNAECVDDQGFRFDLFRPRPGY